MKEIILKFDKLSLAHKLNSEEEQMLRWCKKRHMDMMDCPHDLTILVRFKRDKNTYDFIKEFLEPKVRRALPFSEESFTGLGITIVKSSPSSS